MTISKLTRNNPIGAAHEIRDHASSHSKIKKLKTLKVYGSRLRQFSSKQRH